MPEIARERHFRKYRWYPYKGAENLHFERAEYEVVWQMDYPHPLLVGQKIEAVREVADARWLTTKNWGRVLRRESLKVLVTLGNDTFIPAQPRNRRKLSTQIEERGYVPIMGGDTSLWGIVFWSFFLKNGATIVYGNPRDTYPTKEIVTQLPLTTNGCVPSTIDVTKISPLEFDYSKPKSLPNWVK